MAAALLVKVYPLRDAVDDGCIRCGDRNKAEVCECLRLIQRRASFLPPRNNPDGAGATQSFDDFGIPEHGDVDHETGGYGVDRRVNSRTKSIAQPWSSARYDSST